jgi:hypothetical protein
MEEEISGNPGGSITHTETWVNIDTTDVVV